MSGLSTDGRNDEAVRRLREESAGRIAREARWRTFAAWCAVVTLAGGFSLAGLEARDRRQCEATVPEPEIDWVAIADAEGLRSDDLRAKAELERLAKLEAGTLRTRRAGRAPRESKGLEGGCRLGKLKGPRRPGAVDVDDPLRNFGAL